LTLIFILQGYGVFGVGYTEFLFVASLFALHSIAYFFNQVTSGFRRPEVSTMLGLLLNLLKMAVVVTAAVLGFRYGGLLGMLIAGFLLYTLASVTYPLTSFGFKGSFRVEYVSLLVKFGLGLILATTANNILAWGDIFLIRYFMGDSSVAVYNVAWLTSSACLIFFLSVIQIFNPVVTEFFGRKDYKRASRMSSYILELFFLVFMPVFIAVIAFAREIIVLFFTVDYLPGVIPLQVLSVGIFLFGVALLYRELFSAYGKPQLNAVIVGLAAAVNIVSNYLLIPRLGLLGAALSTLASSAFILALSYIMARRELSFVSVSPSHPRVLKIVVSSFSIIPVVFVLKAAIENSIASLFVSLAAAALVYATALVFSRSLSKLDVELAETLLRNAGVPEEVKKIVLNVMNSGCGS
jgi:O-antigen/teichoic acid export membrane protein